MSWLKEFEEGMRKLDELADKISLPKRYPGYFEKWVFRGVLLAALLLFVYVAHTDKLGFEPMFYMSCPIDVFQGRCANPYYGITCYADVPPAWWEVCKEETLFAGQTYGVPPSALFQNFETICLLLVALGFVVNHLLYVWRSKKWLYSK
jgi:hypothetical protein